MLVRVFMLLLTVVVLVGALRSTGAIVVDEQTLVADADGESEAALAGVPAAPAVVPPPARLLPPVSPLPARGRQHAVRPFRPPRAATFV